MKTVEEDISTSESWDKLDPEEMVTHESAELEEVDFFVQTMDVRSITGRLEDEDLVVPSYQKAAFVSEKDKGNQILGFQRNFVWNNEQMDSLIESVLMEYPIPGVFLIEISDGKYLILDGQQRITTLAAFKEGQRPNTDKTFKLTKVSKKFQDLTFEKLDTTMKRKFNNYPITCTIITAESTGDKSRAVYQLFERINSKGTKLSAHEIRVASYAGPLVGYVEELNSDTNWRELYGNPEKRLRDHQLISRIFALYSDLSSYDKSVKGLIDKFYDENYKLDNSKIDYSQFREYFLLSVRLINQNVGSVAFAPFGKKNEAWIDSLIVGLMRAIKLNRSEEYWRQNLEEKYRILKDRARDGGAQTLAPQYSKRSADKQAVLDRVATAIEVFSDGLR